jgi:hypothetical protein
MLANNISLPLSLPCESDFDALLLAQTGNQWAMSWENLVVKMCDSQNSNDNYEYTSPIDFQNFSPVDLQLSNSNNSFFVGQAPPITLQHSLSYPQVSSKVPERAFVKVNKDGKLLYQCSWKNCTSKFTRRGANSRAHWIRHNTFAPYVCEKCTMGFRRTADLKRHKNTCNMDLN